MVAKICPDRETHRPLIASSSHLGAAASAGAFEAGCWLWLSGVSRSAVDSWESVELRRSDDGSEGSF